ncbi:MAG TPA: hypothetical protein VIU93_14230 [Gallionellaceae bacterium]
MFERSGVQLQEVVGLQSLEDIGVAARMIFEPGPFYFVSLAMTPMLLKDIFEEQIGGQMDEDFRLQWCP